MIDLNTLELILAIVCILLLFGLIFVFYKADKKIAVLYQRLERRDTEIMGLRGKEQNLKKEISKYTKPKELDTNIKNNSLIKETIKTTKPPLKNTYKEEDEEKPINVNFDIPKTRKVFLPSPFEEKRFSIEDVSFDRNQSSLYYIDLDSSGKSGDIYILEDSDFTKALNSPAQFLEKVCLFENAFSNNATRIENIVKGTVVLDGDDWLVKEKIRIKFI